MIRLIRHGTEYWRLHPDGAIERPGLVSPDATSWRIVGAVERNNFGNAVCSYTLAEILANPGNIPWQNKNGTQRTFVRDFDHGTMREWRSPGHRIS